MYKYEFRTAEGRTCCVSDDPEYLCEKCKAALRAQAPDPYAEALRALRQAQGVQEPQDILLSDTEAYDPFGMPPDPYRAALKKLRAA